ncbi:MAG: site-specific integrase [Alphaproteobacteria bacterium]|nr:site-specific integrase [Alphaproteobacteria bacterium]
MAKAKINKKSVDGLRAGETIFDTELRGFMVRARGSSKSFAVKYSVAGRQRIFTLGRYGDLTPEQARTAAQDALNRANKARHDNNASDPQAEREAARVAPKNLVSEICQEFVERHAKRNRSWRETDRILKRHILSVWGRRPIETIRRSDVVTLLDQIEDESGAAMATAVLAQVRKMLNWHATRDDRYVSPIVKGMGRVSPTAQKRTRVLSDNEIRVMWSALDSMEAPFPQIVRALLLTAQRRDEVASMRPEYELKDDLWVIPAGRFKNGRAQTVPLSPFALQQLTDLRSVSEMGEFAFTTTGDRPFSGFSKCKARLDVGMEVILRDQLTDEDSQRHAQPALEPWRLHDLRRTAKTLMARVGVPREISERVLGHVIPGVEGTYDRHDYLKEKRYALNALALEICRIIQKPTRSDTVLPLDRYRPTATTVRRMNR